MPTVDHDSDDRGVGSREIPVKENDRWTSLRTSSHPGSVPTRTLRGGVTMSRPVGGVLFPGPLRGSGSVTIHLCGPPEGSSCEERTGCPALCLALLPVGVADPTGSPRPLVRSYRTVSPLPVPGCPGHRRSVLCCPIREIAPTWLSPAPVPCGAPTFLDTSPKADAAVTRPTHRRHQFGPQARRTGNHRRSDCGRPGGRSAWRLIDRPPSGGSPQAPAFFFSVER